MKKYVKPEIEVIKLRVEERIAADCVPFRLTSDVDIFSDDCFQAQPIENIWSADCYDISDCS